MAVKNSVQAVPVSKLIFSGVSGTYALLGSLTQPCFTMRIMNGTDADITVSYDGGTTDNDYIQAGNFLQINAQQNSQPNNYITNFATGFTVYVKGTEGSKGYIWLSAYYSPRSLV